MLNLPRVVIAGVSSGCGKTSLSIGLMAALRQRGYIVQAAKIGPDYLDPQHHARVTGRPSCNLDSWLCSDEALRQNLLRSAAGADVAVIEGVMGLFDGHGPRDRAGSTADAAAILNTPVVLTLDARGMSRTAGAVVLGMKQFAPPLTLAGVVLNRVSSHRHAQFLRPAIEDEAGVPVLGALPNRPDLCLPSRHLGLVSSGEVKNVDALYEDLGRFLEDNVDMDAILGLARTAPPLTDEAPSVYGHGIGDSSRGIWEKARIAVAMDAAFQFYYAENLRRLEDLGADLCYFSPLSDTALPADAGLLYLGGGYPELHAPKLAANQQMHHAIREYVSRDGAIYAECGGLQYLGEELVTLEGAAYPMAGVLPVRTVMQRKRVALGYVEGTAAAGHPFLPAGTRYRAHEFHYSLMERLRPCEPACEVRKAGESAQPDGVLQGAVVASYAHVHFDSVPQLAVALVRASGASRRSRSVHV